MRWLIDGMNVIGSRPDGWWKDRQAAMVRLVADLQRWAQTDNQQVTVVFEKPPTPPIIAAPVTVAHAPRGYPDSADDEIVRLVRAADDPGQITVVTSDAALIERVRAAGCATAPAAGFRRRISSPGGRRHR
ncbi:NYN domain-containing protein [Mycolicibacillus parakoreensis]|uniref:NYN domain-containing protein n=1 Tax=Mycolicibacillus parakoreensis TaxID=1069221 RepID=A0ABY3U3X4_9MYCO|nr:NYN domain-containing protein [Mycolicibacillus parakoreensis]MCV7317481.1 NYN domain-containing protein [Mycolicibacillus parakoreensis]ULN54198.1 NYN domain-containing protein [Mycolicibacillus parakoreensis]